MSDLLWLLPLGFWLFAALTGPGEEYLALP